MFNNAGILEMTASSGTATVDFVLQNTSATLSNASAGSLELSGGGSFSGSTIVSGTVGINNGSFTAAAGSALGAPSGGAGSLKVTAGTFSLAGAFLAANVLTVAGGLLSGPGTLSAGSEVNWTGGSIGVGLTNAGTLTIAGSGSEVVSGTLTNTGTIDVTGAGTIAPDASGAAINNQAGAIFDFQAAATLSNYDPGVGYPGTCSTTPACWRGPPAQEPQPSPMC